MSDVEKKQAHFSALLVYDVSRWGRFQDVDESAYYEYVVKREGTRVHYCAEQFVNRGQHVVFRAEDVEAFDGCGIQP
jgi:DNA invertase Pin-like site-specific DNA recombinase